MDEAVEAGEPTPMPSPPPKMASDKPGVAGGGGVLGGELVPRLIRRGRVTT